MGLEMQSAMAASAKLLALAVEQAGQKAQASLHGETRKCELYRFTSRKKYS